MVMGLKVMSLKGEVREMTREQERVHVIMESGF